MSESPGARESYAKMVNRAVTTTSMSARLLLVDDKQELLTSLDHLLTLYGYEADQALGGQAAKHALANQEYDVVLLDLIMPEISGHDILDFAAREKLASKIIVVSGDSSFSGVKHALHCGAFDFVKKPEDVTTEHMQRAKRAIPFEVSLKSLPRNSLGIPCESAKIP